MRLTAGQESKMKIISDKAIVNASIDEVFDFLSDAENIYKILPHEKVSDFKADQNGCSFKAPGGFNVPLLYDEKIRGSHIKMRSGEDTPVDFTLMIYLKQLDGNQTEGYLEFDGDVNMFLRMMVEKPLTSLFNSMSHRLQKEFSM